VTAFAQAVQAMPEYAPAHIGLATARLFQYEGTRASNAPQRGWLEQALVHARRACELDPMLGDAWATLGFVLTAAGDVEEARAVSRRATALEPSSWRHQFRLSVATWGEERLRACERTLALLPDFAPTRFSAAMVFVARQAFRQAASAADEGAAARSQQTPHEGAPFPAVGLHWLRGLLWLRDGRAGLAIQSVGREINELRAQQIYASEFRANAQIAMGFAHLAAGDPGGATEAFRLALETLPRQGRALIGLYEALRQMGRAREAEPLLAQVDAAVEELDINQRLSEAALVKAAVEVARGDGDASCTTLQNLLEQAPPGHAGWLIPIDPALAAVRTHPHYPQLMALLRARAT
jgi:tetratricopeptide (TPR) repeat protein